MALVIADRVKETSTTTGTGTFTLDGAATGYQTFASAIGSGNTCYYAITLDSAWEVGIGTVGTGTLARTTVLKSSNSNTAVNFGAGTKDVFVTYIADKAVYKDANGDVVGLKIGTDVQAYDADLTTWAGKTAPSGTVVGTTDTQTLTGKTISVDDNTVSGIAASSFVLSNASGNIDGTVAQKAIPSGAVVGTTDTQTLTGKTITYADNTLTGVQPTLVSGTSIKTVNSTSLLGSGNVAVQETLVSGTNIKTVNSNSLLGSGNVSVGDVTGPASSTASNVATFNGTTGKIIQDSGKALPTGTVVGTSDTQTLTNKTIALGSNTVSGTIAQFNTAVTDADFATLAGTETLTNKTITAGVLSGDTTGGDGLLTRVMLQDTGWDYFDSGSTAALNYVNGSVQRWAPTASSSPTLSITNWPPSGALGELFVEAVNLGAAGTITWPTINWVKSDGTTTTTFGSNGVTLQSSGTDFFILWTRNAGTTIYGKFVR